MLKEFEHKVHNICEKINMPVEITEKIINEILHFDFSNIADDFCNLFNMTTGGEAVKNIEVKLKDSADSLKPLTVYLAAATKTWEQYERLGISKEVFIDTMKMFSRFVHEHYETFGFYGFDRDFWIYRILSASLFRLGTLEFEMKYCQNNEPFFGYVKEGDCVVSVHIPSDAVLSRANLDYSYAAARKFWGNYFPKYEDAAMFCRSWLLDPALMNLLPADSKILIFQSDYKILNLTRDSQEFMTWVYKRKYPDYSLLPENTTLQKNLKKFLLSGNALGTALGIKP